MTTFHLKTLLFFCLLTGYITANAQGILFSEHRLILKDRAVQTLQVCNPTEEIRNFQLSIIDKTVDASHKLVDIPDSVTFASSLKSMVRVFPKRITLAPGECQEVQLQLRSTNELPDGEYRSYLHFLPLLTRAETTPDSTVAQKADAPSFDIIVRIGAAIPLIYRKNAVLEKLSIDSVSLARDESGKPSLLSFYIHRAGSKSVYGNISVFCDSKDPENPAAISRGNAIYAEAPGRQIEIPITEEKLQADSAGKYSLRIVYENNESGQRKETLCEWTGEVK